MGLKQENVFWRCVLDKKFNLKEYVKADKKRAFILIALAVGVLLILLSLSGTDKKDSSSSEGTLAEYKAELEKELSELCSSIEGAGKCTVTVSFAEGVKTEYKGNNKISETPPRVLGITVVSDGGANAEVKSAITECMTALFDIRSNRVAVLQKK